MKKALLVGINSYPTSPLRGCVNDVEDWFDLLTSVGKYQPDHIRAVCDDRATTEGIKSRMDWLKEGISGPGDEVTFQYSGHGSQVRDRWPEDELADHMDEILCPVDLDWRDKVITDDYLGEWIRSFPIGTRIIVILDCCHSGTGTRGISAPVLENPHYKAERFLPPPIDILLRGRAVAGNRSIQNKKFGRGQLGHRSTFRAVKKRSKWPCMRRKTETVYVPVEKPPEEKKVEHILISGCRSDQTSADAFIGSRYNGAMTYYMVKAIKENPDGPIETVHAKAKAEILSSGYTQESQLEGPEIKVKERLLIH